MMEPLKDFNNRIIGYIDTDPRTNNQIGYDFYKRIVGYYDAKLNVTQDFYKRIISRGNTLSGLVMMANKK